MLYFVTGARKPHWDPTVQCITTNSMQYFFGSIPRINSPELPQVFKSEVGRHSFHSDCVGNCPVSFHVQSFVDRMSEWWHDSVNDDFEHSSCSMIVITLHNMAGIISWLPNSANTFSLFVCINAEDASTVNMI